MFYEFLSDLKQHCINNILPISFICKTDRNYRIDWICYYEEFISAQDALKFYGEIWIFNGIIDRE